MSAASDPKQRRGGQSEVLPALGLAVLGAFLLISAPNIDIPVGEYSVGPRFFPYVIGAGLVLVGLALAIAVLMGNRAEPEGGEDVDADASTDWVTLGLVVATLAAYVVIINPVGYLLSTMGLFAAIAWILGARKPAQLAVISFVAPLVVYLLFTRGLGIYLPNGILEAVI